ncbi:MAG: GMC family oxidoreductase N-terminal domain-containing protein, partial [Steroidobacteraceae bacterium]
MRSFDYVIVGSGAAGCVIAYRLSADPGVSVALVEAGPRDTHPFIHMPKGMGKVMQDPKHLWPFPCEPEAGTAMTAENWLRGRVLGGSTAINGMMYVRGQPADFDALAAATSEEWSWRQIAKAYSELESHELGAGIARGAAGPLKVTLPTDRDELNEAFIAAGAAMGWSTVQDVNAPDDIERIGYAPRTIYRGRRQSAATAFLHPVRDRPNLTILTDTLVDTVLFDGRSAIGINVITGEAKETIHAHREVILCAGALASPLILQRSGIGAPALLASLGVPLVSANPAVGQNLSEHRGILMQWKLRREISQNREFRGPRLLKNTARYYLFKRGPL